MAAVIPVAKSLFLADNVLLDQGSQKIHVLGIYNTVRPPEGSGYPFRLRRLCAFCQLADAIGHVAAHIRIVDLHHDRALFRSTVANLYFASRRSTVAALFRLPGLVFPSPGIYCVELYCQEQFVDDRLITLLSMSGSMP
jgi:hypothetical protein